MILVLASLLLAGQAVDTAGWVSLGEPRPGYHLSYDPAPVGRAGDTVTFRLILRYPATEDGRSYNVSTAEIRCAAREARVVRTTVHRDDGSVAREDSQPVAFQAINEDSFYGRVRQALC